MNNLQIPGYWTKVEGLDVHYKCAGSGMAVILIHGGAGDWSEWQKNLAFLSRNFRVFAPDLPGFGLSGSPDIFVSLPWFSSFLRGFMDALGIGSAHLIGHSLGGTIAMAFALDFPERVEKVVLVDSGGLGELSWQGRLILFLVRGVKRMVGKEKSPSYMPGSMEDWLVINRMSEFKSPAMIVWGKRDPYLPLSQAKLAHSLIQNCQLHVFPRCHHAPQRENSEEFNNLVHQFLMETAGGNASAPERQFG